VRWRAVLLPLSRCGARDVPAWAIQDMIDARACMFTLSGNLWRRLISEQFTWRRRSGGERVAGVSALKVSWRGISARRGSLAPSRHERHLSRARRALLFLCPGGQGTAAQAVGIRRGGGISFKHAGIIYRFARSLFAAGRSVYRRIHRALVLPSLSCGAFLPLCCLEPLSSSGINIVAGLFTVRLEHISGGGVGTGYR